MKSLYFVVLGLVAAISFSKASTGVVIVDDNTINAGQTYNMVNTHEYVLKGLVFVEEGAVLNIQPGTIIRGMTGGTGNDASALVICRGAKIIAEGTASQPIHFTALTDNIADPFDLGPNARGLWGGLIICGYGKMSTDSMKVEGLSSMWDNDPRAWAGGNNDDDSSGVLKYVSVRHAGAAIATGDEINGITLYGVGRRTVIEFVEVYASDDDGIEWFGGAVNTKYTVVSFVNDDAFDCDQGYRGKGQFWFGIFNGTASIMGRPDRGFEFSGLAKNPNLSYYTKPVVYNFTLIGAGQNASTPAQDVALMFNERCGGIIRNGIIGDFPKKAVRINDAWAVDAEEQLYAGELSIKNCMFFNFGAGSTWSAITSRPYEVDSLSAYNWIRDPLLRGIARVPSQQWLDPRPYRQSPACSSSYIATPPNDGFFTTPVTHLGAFSRRADQMWLYGWTQLSRSRILTKLLQIIPASHEVYTQGNYNFDLSFLLKISTQEASATANYKVFINNTDVTQQFTDRSSAAGARYINGTAGSNDGIIYRVPNVQMNEIGAPGYYPHVIRTEFPMTNGMVLRDTLIIRVMQ